MSEAEPRDRHRGRGGSPGAPRRWLSRLPRRARAAAGGTGARVLAVDLLAAILVFHNAWSSPRTSWAGGCCDAEQSMWFLGWAPYWITHLGDPFVTHHINSPDGVNLMWNASISLPAVLLAPVTALGGPVLAYNLLLTLGVALSAWTATLLLRRHTRHAVAAAVGGLVYGLSPYVLGQAMGHINLVLVLTPPLVVMLIEDLVASHRSPRRLGIALGGVAVAQLLVSPEILATEAIAGGVLLLVLGFQHPSAVPRAWTRAVTALPVALGVVVVLGGWPLAVFLFGPERPTSSPQPPDVFVTDLVNTVVPTDTQWWSPAAALREVAHFTGLGLENSGYIGVPLLLLAAWVAGRHGRRPDVRAAVVVGIVLFVLSLGPHLHVGGVSGGPPLPWALLAHVPLLDGALPGRLSLYVGLVLALLVAVAVDDVLRIPRRPALAGLAAVAIALIPWLPRTDYPQNPAVLPALFTSWDDAHVPDGDVVLVAPFIRDGGQADPMLWQAAAGDRFRMPQGYYYIPDQQGRPVYGALPSTLSDIMERIQEKGVLVRAVGPALRAIDSDIRARHITTIVVGPMSHRAEMVNFFTLLLGRPAVAVDGCQLWRGVDSSGVDLSAT